MRGPAHRADASARSCSGASAGTNIGVHVSAYIRACDRPSGWARSSRSSQPTAPSRSPRSRRGSASPRPRSGATSSCSRSSACSRGPTAAPSRRACCTSCRSATRRATPPGREAPHRARGGRAGRRRDAVGLTGGTTCTEVARALVDRQRLTVVTNALNIAGELAVRPNLKLVVTGGTARPESYELVGPLAERALAELHLDSRRRRRRDRRRRRAAPPTTRSRRTPTAR